MAKQFIRGDQMIISNENVLARARSICAGLRLVQFEVEEIALCVKSGWISPEQALRDLAALEQLPVCVAWTLLQEEGFPA